VTAPVAGDLVALIVVDSPQTTRTLKVTELAALGLDAKGAFAAALANVRSEIGPLSAKVKLPLPKEGLGYLTPEHYYNCAFVSAPAEWATVAKSTKGIYVSVPSDQTVLYGDAGNPTGLAALKVITAEMFGKADRPVSKTILQWSESGWKAVQ
jgi:hypothetical protein